MLNVRDFGAFGDGVTPDTNAINNALIAARSGGGGSGAPVYFPSGTYIVTAGIDISGTRILGEPYHGGARPGTIIKVADSVERLSGGVLFSGAPATDPTKKCPKRQQSPVEVSRIQVDANHKAEYGVALYGAAGMNVNLWLVIVRNAVLDGFLLDACQSANFWMVGCYSARRHGIHLIDCNGARLTHCTSHGSGSAPAGGNSSRDGYGLLIENECHSGGVYVQGGDIEHGHGPAIYVRNNLPADDTPTIIERVWVENSTPTDNIVLEGSRNVVVQNCRISGGEKDNPNVRAIRLKNGAFNNLIRDNFILGNGAPLPGSGGLTTGDQIEIEPGCANNHVENNLSLRRASVGVPVKFSDRTHVLGQQQVISYGEIAPIAGTWQKGDIVLNTNPTVGSYVGWVCSRGGAPGTWNQFGLIM